MAMMMPKMHWNATIYLDQFKALIYESKSIIMQSKTTILKKIIWKKKYTKEQLVRAMLKYNENYIKSLNGYNSWTIQWNLDDNKLNARQNK
jgi:hypothetical protein